MRDFKDTHSTDDVLDVFLLAVGIDLLKLIIIFCCFSTDAHLFVDAFLHYSDCKMKMKKKRRDGKEGCAPPPSHRP